MVSKGRGAEALHFVFAILLRDLPVPAGPFHCGRVCEAPVNPDPPRKSDSIFSRYNIVSEDGIRDAAKKIEAGSKAAIHSSCTFDVQEEENRKEKNARQPV